MLDATTIPNEVLPNETERIVRVDLRDRANPRRAYDLDLADTFWQLEARGDRIYVLESVVQPPPSRCGNGGRTLGWEGGCRMPTAMR